MPYEATIREIRDTQGRPVERALTNRIVIVDAEEGTELAAEICCGSARDRKAVTRAVMPAVARRLPVCRVLEIDAHAQTVFPHEPVAEALHLIHFRRAKGQRIVPVAGDEIHADRESGQKLRKGSGHFHGIIDSCDRTYSTKNRPPLPRGKD